MLVVDVVEWFAGCEAELDAQTVQNGWEPFEFWGGGEDGGAGDGEDEFVGVGARGVGVGVGDGGGEFSKEDEET